MGQKFLVHQWDCSDVKTYRTFPRLSGRATLGVGYFYAGDASLSCCNIVLLCCTNHSTGRPLIVVDKSASSHWLILPACAGEEDVPVLLKIAPTGHSCLLIAARHQTNEAIN